MTDARLTRRQLLAGAFGVGAAAALAGCTHGTRPVGSTAIASAESSRPRTGAVRSFTLAATPVQVDLGGRVVSTWAYGDSIPGAALRVRAGDRVQVAFANQLPEETSVHWHGLAIRNDMDGVPGVTMAPIPAGGSFAYDFVVPDPGTHWFHPHTGLQLDRGLYAPFIVDDPGDPGDYDHEWVVVLDDWLDGLPGTPDQAFAALVAAGQEAQGGMGSMMGGMHPGMGGMEMMSDDGGDVTHPLFLINGRPGNDPDTLTATPGQRIRLRIINAAADTIFTLAVGGHRITVTHTDGYPVAPIDVGALRIGMGERYDAVLTLADGVFPVVAEPVGKPGVARALIRTGSGSAPDADLRLAELDGYPLTVDALSAAPGAALPKRAPDTVSPLALTGSMAPYLWTINGRTYEQTQPLTIRAGQLGRYRITNHSMMSHPMHIHGHTFQLGPSGGTGPRKDTVLVPPMGAVSVDLAADNPGSWMVHCHNAYHAEAGMMTRLDYTT